MARIQILDSVYEYDGMSNNGKFQVAERSNPLAEKIMTMSGSQYKAQMAWYKRDI